MRKLFSITKENTEFSGLQDAISQLSFSTESYKRHPSVEGFLDLFKSKQSSQEKIRLDEENVLQHLHDIKGKINTDVRLTHSFYSSVNTPEELMKIMDTFISLSSEIDQYQKIKQNSYALAVSCVLAYIKKDSKTVEKYYSDIKVEDEKLNKCFSNLVESGEDMRTSKNETYCITRIRAGGLGDYPDEGSPTIDYSFYAAIREQSRQDKLSLCAQRSESSILLDAGDTFKLVEKMEKLINASIHSYRKWCGTTSPVWNSVRKISKYSDDDSLDEFTTSNVSGLTEIVYNGDVDGLSYEYMFYTLKLAMSLMKAIDSKLNFE
jgi:hypothetical protein